MGPRGPPGSAGASVRTNLIFLISHLTTTIHHFGTFELIFHAIFEVLFKKKKLGFKQEVTSLELCKLVLSGRKCSVSYLEKPHTFLHVC